MDSEVKWRLAVDEFADQMRALYGPTLDRVVLFGPRARNDAAEDSDVDLFVVLITVEAAFREMRKIDLIASAISLRHDVVLVPFVISTDEFQRGRQPFVLAGHREGVPVS